MNGLRIRVRKDPAIDGIELVGFYRDGNRGFYIGKPDLVEFKEGQIIDSFLSITNLSAQVLMDDLWAAGFRPAENRWVEGERMAMKDHLSDLRNILFTKLKIKT